MKAHTDERKDFEDGEVRARTALFGYFENKGYEIALINNVKYDYEVIIDGNPYTVEGKFRNFWHPNQYNDILVELVQDIETYSRGWFYSCQAQWLHYVICVDWSPVYYYAVNMGSFKSFFVNWMKERKHGTWVVSSRGEGITLNMSLPVRDLPAKIYKRYELDTD